MRLVDAHVHLLPDRLARAIRSYFLQALPAETFPYAPEADAALAALRDAGVARCWSLPYVRKAGSAAALNHWMAETWRGHDLVEPGATVHPEDDVAVVVDAALALGARLFKVHCAVGGHPVDDPRLDPLWARVSERGLPVVVHLGHSPAGPTDEDELPGLDAVATRWPRARIILAHLAAPSVAGAVALLRRHPALHADLTPVVVHPAPVRAEDLEGLEERILFGSDVPAVGLTHAAVVAHVRGLGLSTRAEAAILGGTADRLVPPP